MCEASWANGGRNMSERSSRPPARLSDYAKSMPWIDDLPCRGLLRDPRLATVQSKRFLQYPDDSLCLDRP